MITTAQLLRQLAATDGLVLVFEAAAVRGERSAELAHRLKECRRRRRLLVQWLKVRRHQESLAVVNFATWKTGAGAIYAISGNARAA